MDKQLRNLIIITVIMTLITPTIRVEDHNGNTDLQSIGQIAVNNIREY